MNRTGQSFLFMSPVVASTPQVVLRPRFESIYPVAPVAINQRFLIQQYNWRRLAYLGYGEWIKTDEYETTNPAIADSYYTQLCMLSKNNIEYTLVRLFVFDTRINQWDTITQCLNGQ